MIGAFRGVGGIAPFGNNVQIDVQQGRLYMGSAEVDAKEIVGCLVHVGVRCSDLAPCSFDGNKLEHANRNH